MKDFIAIVILSTLIPVLMVIGVLAYRQEYVDKPYILILDKPNLEDIEKCKKAPNCMDILSLDDLPKRKDSK